MKKIKQKYIDELEKLEKAVETGEKGLITEINEITNTKYFGVQSNYGERNGIAITVKINSPNIEEFTNWISIPDKVRGIEKSNIWAFKQKYGSYPEVGVEVDCKLDENGFFKIDF